MAFTQSAAPSATPSSDNWKAQGFLNLYIPGLNGQRKKLGAIPLKDSKPNEKKLMEWLTEDPTRIAQLLAKLEIEYQSALPSDTSGFDLGM